MSLWMVRGGKHGEQEALALENDLACIGWYEAPDLTGSKNRDQLREILQKTYPHWNESQLNNQCAQLNAFIFGMKTGDLVIMPLKTTSQIAIGGCLGHTNTVRTSATRIMSGP